MNGSWYYQRDLRLGAFGDDPFYCCYSNGQYLINGKIYSFDKNGKWIGTGIKAKDGWNLLNGDYYYYEDGYPVRSTLKTIKGKTYCFDAFGKMLYSTISMINGKYYALDHNGEVVKNNWIQLDDIWYYCYANGDLAEGKQTINGKNYYFYSYLIPYRYPNWSISTPKYGMLTGTIKDDGTGKIYCTDNSGAIIQEYSAAKNGWQKTVNGEWLYGDNGHFLSNKTAVINEKSYYFLHNGVMAADMGVYTGYADSQGVIHHENTGYCYANGDYMDGARLINGKHYYFQGRYMASELWLIGNYAKARTGVYDVDGNLYYYDGNGNRTVLSRTNGWHKINSDWYYIKDNELVSSFWNKINGHWYLFYDGLMQRDCFEYIYFDGLCYLDQNGEIKTGWFTKDGKTYYADETGKLATGVQVISGKTYNFTSLGVLL